MRFIQGGRGAVSLLVVLAALGNAPWAGAQTTTFRPDWKGQTDKDGKPLPAIQHRYQTSRFETRSFAKLPTLPSGDYAHSSRAPHKATRSPFSHLSGGLRRDFSLRHSLARSAAVAPSKPAPAPLLPSSRSIGLP